MEKDDVERARSVQRRWREAALACPLRPLLRECLRIVIGRSTRHLNFHCPGKLSTRSEAGGRGPGRVGRGGGFKNLSACDNYALRGPYRINSFALRCSWPAQRCRPLRFGASRITRAVRRWALCFWALGGKFFLTTRNRTRYFGRV